MGDFNNHGNVSGCRSRDQKGRIIEDIINRNILPFFNNKMNIYAYITNTYVPREVKIQRAVAMRTPQIMKNGQDVEIQNWKWY